MARSARRSANAVTMQTVAQRAGVSAMTVSNVLNGRNVQPHLRDAVNRAIRDLNYVPNPAARALASASAVRIGLIYRSAATAYLSQVLVGALDAVSAQGASLLIRQYGAEGLESGLDAMRALIDSGANALLLPPPFCEAVSRDHVMQHLGVPVMAMSPGDELDDMPAVRIDDRQAAYDMTAHLITLGHRRIGFIRAPESHIISRSRRDGYCAALADHGLAKAPELIVQGQMTFDSGLVATQQLLDLADRPTAIFASNDDMAAAAVSLAHRRGLDIPGELSIAGFDDSPVASKIWPALTSVHQPVVGIARAAAEALVARVRGQPGGEAETRYLPHHIVLRDSTGPAAA